MSAAWMKLATILSVSCSGLADPESREMLWRERGASVTIQCRSSESQVKHLELRKGLNEHVSVVQKSETSGQIEIGGGFTGRVQVNGAFPNVDVLIKNLSSDDTGPYWCMYRLANPSGTEAKQGSGSVLVVVRGDRFTPASCTTPDQNLIPVWAMLAAAAPLTIIMCVLMWLIKNTTAQHADAVTYASVKPRPDPNSCVYEDMNGRLRPPPASGRPTGGSGEGGKQGR